MRFLFQGLQLLDTSTEILIKRLKSPHAFHNKSKFRHLLNIQQGRYLGLQLIDGSLAGHIRPLVFIRSVTHRAYRPSNTLR